MKRRKLPPRLVCFNCRQKHIRCDRSRPCEPCQASGLICESKASHPESTYSAPGLEVLDTLKSSGSPFWVQLGSSQLVPNPSPFKSNQDFYQFSLHVIKVWPDMIRGRTFFVDALIPGSQIHDVVQHALTCYISLQRRILNETSKLCLPRSVICEYSKSLSRPLGDLPILLLTACLYIMIESRLAHYQNISNLLRTTFSLVYSFRHIIAKDHMQDIALFGCLYELLDLTINRAVDPRVVDEEHWQAHIALLLRMALVNGQSTEEFLLNIESYNIRFLIASADFSDESITLQLEDLYRRVLKQETRPLASRAETFRLANIRGYLAEARIYWYFARWKRYGSLLDRDLFRRGIEAALKSFEDQGKTMMHSAFIAYADEIFIRKSIFIAWFWRAESVVDRIKAVLESVPFSITYIEDVLDYLNVLLMTDYNVRTKLEEQAWASMLPEVPQRWQLWRLANELALDAS